MDFDLRREVIEYDKDMSFDEYLQEIDIYSDEDEQYSQKAESNTLN
jgi:hypothetical protein